MGKILLTGNGTTSQLIYSYKDEYMIEEFKKQKPEAYDSINRFFNTFRVSELATKDETKAHVLCVLQDKGFSNHATIYKTFFEDYGLYQETKKKHVTNIEALLKVARLNNFDNSLYGEVEKTANSIYYNNGHHGLKAIDNKLISLEKFKIFINEFRSVFTTNYDSILDELSEKEVYHLHGGFYYTREKKDNGEIHIVKSKKHSIPDASTLIWGTDAEEKIEKMHGGFTIPMSFPFNPGGYSILDEYYRGLQSIDVDQLFIWGFSGYNDAHINEAISKNPNIKKIYKYCNPANEANDSNYKKLIEEMYPHKEIFLLGWDMIWKQIE